LSGMRRNDESGLVESLLMRICVGYPARTYSPE
jgi:hypothetical protein